MDSNRLEDYLALLNIRRAAKRRDAVITGGTFLISFLALIALAMLDRLTGRSLYLAAAIITALGFGYRATWIRLEVIKGSIELIENLL